MSRRYTFFGHEASRPLTAIVKVATIEETVLASGTIEPSDLISVGAQASGRITALYVALGDRVSRGELIAEIDPSTQRNAFENAEASLDQDHAQRKAHLATLRQAELAFQRIARTYAVEASSQADYEAAKTSYEVAKAELAAVDAQIRQAVIAVNTARVNLGFTKVTAPIDGTVIAIVSPAGQTVNASQTAPTIVKLADLSSMIVKCRVSEADVTHVRPGQRVYFSIFGRPDHRYETTLKAIEPAADVSGAASSDPSDHSRSSPVYYSSLLEIANPDGQLRPSMTAEIHIVLKEAKNALVIPSIAVTDQDLHGQHQTVLVLDAAGKTHSRSVQLGIDNHIDVQILSGLAVGEQIVIASGDPAQ
jgi:membrane fusion protein, macrolide-specific efflux system